MQLNIRHWDKFQDRHNGPSEAEINQMLEVIGENSVDELISKTVPGSIRLKNNLDLPEALTEVEFLDQFKNTLQKNKLFKSYIGMGYYDTTTPAVILRNVLENPGWYTAYTPYQAEIAQGRLEALINFQTMVIDLTGMEIANASLLDEGTAAAEAFSMMLSVRKGAKKKANTIYVDENVFPQTLAVIKTRMEPLGINLVIGDIFNLDLTNEDLVGIMVQNPDNNGEVRDLTDLFSAASENQVFTCVAADLMSLLLVKSPGEMGADIVVGSSQRFGIPMGFGGPHAAFFATKEAYKRQIPGRIIGASMDSRGKNGYRMALQTREQHIRREKATSNICTAQVLLAVMAGFYAVYHGPDGLKGIAGRIHGLSVLLKKYLEEMGATITNVNFFDTLKVHLPEGAYITDFRTHAEEAEINFRYFEDHSIGISINETTTIEDLGNILNVFAKSTNSSAPKADEYDTVNSVLSDELIRTSEYLTHPVFHSYRSEHEMLRYLKSLERKDLSLVHSMISLGSCTMKLNATAEMIPVTWPELGKLHPYTPIEQTNGYQHLFEDLEKWLNEITGFTATSLQPNSGAQGEYAGLMVIRAYHLSHGDDHRNIALIPSSAHGTNPASAVMAGMNVVIVACDEKGNIDVEDLKSKANQYKDNLGALMVTYPSTHGVFEESIKEICDVIHENGGLVYMDGANMNAQVGLTSPANIGADVCHLNLHKTFCIPHGGGGPGMGPICVNDKLAPFLPGNPIIKTGGSYAISSVSAAPWGSASILAISYAYIAMMGGNGLRRATEIAILNSNYIKERLKEHYPILYTGTNDKTAHEFIVDCRKFKEVGIEVEDIAKRLMDYGFHAPTVSFPVPGTMMIEPTESESKEELDKFCKAMIGIREEISEIQNGKADKEDNVLKNAPHTADMITSDSWTHGYSREKAAYPASFVMDGKFWPTVGRIDSAYGDRNLVCSCLPIEAYQEEAQEEAAQEA